MRLRIVFFLLFPLLLSNGCKKTSAEVVKSVESRIKMSAQTQCVTPLALADVTSKKDLTWNQRSDGTEVTSTVTYGAHSVLAISVEFTGDDLRYRVVSMNHPDAKPDLITAADGTQCAYSLSGKSLTGYAEIETLCAGETYHVFLQTCNRNGDCSDETSIAKPYLQDRNRDAGIQAALAGVDQSRQALDGIAEKAYQTIVAYYDAHKDDPNPSPERKQFLSMAQRVENMGLDLYKTVAYTQYGQVQDTLQSNLQLVGTPAAAAPAQNGCAPENQLLLPNPSAPSALALAGNMGTDTQTDASTTSDVKKRKEGITLLVIGTIGAVAGSVVLYKARTQLRDLVNEKQTLIKANEGLQESITGSLEEKTKLTNEMKQTWAEWEAAKSKLYEAQNKALEVAIEKNAHQKSIYEAKADLTVHSELLEAADKAWSIKEDALVKTNDFLSVREEMLSKVTKGEDISLFLVKENEAFLSAKRALMEADEALKAVLAIGEKNPGALGKTNEKLVKQITFAEKAIVDLSTSEAAFKAKIAEYDASYTDKLARIHKHSREITPAIQNIDAKLALNQTEIHNNTKEQNRVSAKEADAKFNRIAGLVIGISMLAVAILGAVLTGVGANLADTGTSPEVALLTVLSPLTQELDNAFLKNYGAYLPLQTAIKASTASK